MLQKPTKMLRKCYGYPTAIYRTADYRTLHITTVTTVATGFVGKSHGLLMCCDCVDRRAGLGMWVCGCGQFRFAVFLFVARAHVVLRLCFLVLENGRGSWWTQSVVLRISIYAK